MVELRAENPAMRVRAMAREAVKKVGPNGPGVETLRKRFADLERAGELPIAESHEIRLGRKIIEFTYAARNDALARIKDELAASECEAAALGLNVSAAGLSDRLRELTTERNGLEISVRQPGFFAGKMIEAGRSEAEADAEFVAQTTRLKQVRKEIEIVEAIHQARQRLAEAGIFTQNQGELGRN